MINLYNISNEKVELYEEDGQQFLRLDFDYENSYGFYKGHIERIKLDIKLTNIERESYFHGDNIYVDLGLEKMRVIPNNGDIIYTLTLVKEKVQEMTMEEIEKELGHKVKIVTKK